MSEHGFHHIDLPGVPVVEGFHILPPVVVYGLIGTGGSGKVFVGVDGNTGADVAVKCLTVSDERVIRRFDNEARVGAEIDHPAFVRVRELGREPNTGMRYFTMDLVAGESAKERVVRRGPMTPADAAQVMVATAEGLAELHRRGMVHRDIKPANILLSLDGEVRLADLGLLREMNSLSELTMTGDLLGTPSFMAPEQAKSPREVGPAADVFALGATYVYLLTGKAPLQAGGRIQIAPSRQLAAASDAVLTWIHTCIDPDPLLRFQDAAAALAALRAIRAEVGKGDLRDPAMTRRLDEWRRMRPSGPILERIRRQVDLTRTPRGDDGDRRTIRRLTFILLAVITVALGAAAGLLFQR